MDRSVALDVVWGAGPLLEQLQPYIDSRAQRFGPKRLMYESDWLVIMLVGEYVRRFSTVGQAIAKLSKSLQDRIMGGTAAEAYGI